MYRLFQRFTPAFLRKLDHQLLVSRPGLWATRVHYLLFYWLIGAGLASLLLMLMPVQLNNVPRGENSSIMMMIVSGIALLAWAIQLAHYQPWKQGESHWRLHALRDQGVYFLGVGLLLLLPLGFYAIHQQRVDLAIDDTELKADRQSFDIALLVMRNSAEELENEQKKYSTGYGLTSRESKMRALKAYQIVAAKYGPRDMAYALDLEKILELHSNGENAYRKLSSIRELNYKVRDNLFSLQRAERPILRNTSDRLIPFAIWASIGLVLLVFVRSSWQTFLLSFVSGLGLILLESLPMSLIFATGVFHNEEMVLVVLFGLNWLVLGGIAFIGDVKSSRQQKIRMIALSLFTVLTTIIPVFSKELLMGGSDKETTILYLLSCGLTLLLWNLFIQTRMLQLVVSPKKQ